MKLFLSLVSWLFFIGSPDLASIRKMYPTVAKSETNAKAFFAKLADVSNNDQATVVAYKAASILLNSKFEKKLHAKIDRFKEGTKLLESTVKRDSNNIEIRMIRLSVQENAPGITGYKKNIYEDKIFIITNYKAQNTPLKEYLKAFILQSKSFSEKEKQFAK